MVATPSSAPPLDDVTIDHRELDGRRTGRARRTREKVAFPLEKPASQAEIWTADREHARTITTNICSHRDRTEGAGGEGFAPAFLEPKPRVLLAYTTPQWLARGYAVARGEARYPPHPMAEPFTVLIMAAGQGTRMRSDAPKVLHRVCGKPMVEWVIDAARDARARAASSAWSGPATAWPRGCRTGVEVAEQTRGRGHRRRGARRARRGRARGRSWSSPATTRSSRPSRSPTCSTSTAASGATRHPAHHRRARPGRLRPHRPRRRRRGRAHRRDQVPRRRPAGGARHPRDQPRHLRLRGARPSFEALDAGRPPERRALPDRRLPDPPRRRRAHRHAAHDRRPRQRASA